MNQLYVMKVKMRPKTEESEATKIIEIPDDTVDSDKVYYHGSHELLHFKNIVWCQ